MALSWFEPAQIESDNCSNFNRYLNKLNQLFKLLTSWLPYGRSIDQELFFIKDFIQDKAEQVLHRLKLNIATSISAPDISYVSFIVACSQCGLTEENSCKLVKLQLIKDNKILSYYIKRVEYIKIIKSVNFGEPSVQPPTDIKTTVSQLDKFNTSLKRKLNEVNEEIEEASRKRGKNEPYPPSMTELQHQHAELEQKLGLVKTALTCYEYYPYELMVIKTHLHIAGVIENFLQTNELTPKKLENLVDTRRQFHDVLNTLQQASDNNPNDNNTIYDTT